MPKRKTNINQALDYLAYYNNDQIFLYAYKALCKFFWSNFLKKLSSGEWKICVGANNPWGITILAPSEEGIDRCVRKIIPRRKAPPAEPEGGDSEPEIPDEAEL